jgi:hypothetical protein
MPKPYAWDDPPADQRSQMSFRYAEELSGFLPPEVAWSLRLSIFFHIPSLCSDQCKRWQIWPEDDYPDLRHGKPSSALGYGDHPKHPYIPPFSEYCLDTFVHLGIIIQKKEIT